MRTVRRFGRTVAMQSTRQIRHELRAMLLPEDNTPLAEAASPSEPADGEPVRALPIAG